MLIQAARDIEQSFASLKIGAPMVRLNFALFPLLDDGDGAPGYVLLDDVLERKLARVTEVSPDGRVPELAFENDSAEKILLVHGDELVGAKQNRVLNLSILVGGRQKLVIPVSCVAQARGRYHSRDFQSARRSLFAKARAKKMRQVTESLRVNQDRRSNQSEVWADVAGKVAFCQADSETLAMADAYESRGRQLSAYVSAFRRRPRPARCGSGHRRQAGRARAVRLCQRVRALPREPGAELRRRCNRDRGRQNARSDRGRCAAIPGFDSHRRRRALSRAGRGRRYRADRGGRVRRRACRQWARSAPSGLRGGVTSST